MLASAVTRPMQTIQMPNPKTRLLLVSDSPNRLRALQSGLNPKDFDITAVSSFEELVIACHEHHDIVALDVSPAQIAPILKLIRSSELHATIPVLVEATQLRNDLNLAGLLPRYRAMPCSYTEMLTLVRGGSVSAREERVGRGML
jgi:PleD family two-component response regulator